jgi:C-3',4' desaturase CrtD
MFQDTDVVVIGSGMAGLSTACLLARDGLHVTLLEQNWLPGGCSSSYSRKGYVFESGATTLVGLDDHMPLRWLLDQLGIDLAPLRLDVPMQVHLADGEVLTRYQDLEAWIGEAERVFGPEGQRAFWTYCYQISQAVWQTSISQRAFPPSSLSDLWYAAQHFHPRQIGFALKAFRSTADLLRRFGLDKNRRFIDFVNEQLLITAQNYLEEVNVPFGATALCYTNYGNYYMPGGLINLINPLVAYLQQRGSELVLRAPVSHIIPDEDHYLVQTTYRGEVTTYRSPKVVSAIPINNTLDLFADDRIRQKFQSRLMTSTQLNSAFQMGFVFKKRQRFSCLHHQIHLDTPLPYTGSHSIFLSLSHPDDQVRCGPDEVVASISTHAPDPAHRLLEDKSILETLIFDVLVERGFFEKEDILYHHASTPGAWEKWTHRAYGFVGGYPQYLRIKPWQMIDARLDHRGAYLAGDSTYPGQGIPGATLSGIIAYQKMRLDGIKPSKRISHPISEAAKG